MQTRRNIEIQHKPLRYLILAIIYGGRLGGVKLAEKGNWRNKYPPILGTSDLRPVQLLHCGNALHCSSPFLSVYASCGCDGAPAEIRGTPTEPSMTMELGAEHSPFNAF